MNRFWQMAAAVPLVVAMAWASSSSGADDKEITIKDVMVGECAGFGQCYCDQANDHPHAGKKGNEELASVATRSCDIFEPRVIKKFSIRNVDRLSFGGR